MQRIQFVWELLQGHCLGQWIAHPQYHEYDSPSHKGLIKVSKQQVVNSTLAYSFTGQVTSHMLTGKCPLEVLPWLLLLVRPFSSMKLMEGEMMGSGWLAVGRRNDIGLPSSSLSSWRANAACTRATRFPEGRGVGGGGVSEGEREC